MDKIFHKLKLFIIQCFFKKNAPTCICIRKDRLICFTHLCFHGLLQQHHGIAPKALQVLGLFSWLDLFSFLFPPTDTNAVAFFPSSDTMLQGLFFPSSDTNNTDVVAYFPSIDTTIPDAGSFLPLPPLSHSLYFY